MSEWDGKVVMSTPGGPVIEMSLGEYVARKNAEIERLRAENERLREALQYMVNVCPAIDLDGELAHELAREALEGKP